jgi:hypothetical protein
MITYNRYSNPKDLNEVEYMIDLENGIGIIEYCYEGFLERGGDKIEPIIISGNSIIEIVDGKPVLNLATLRTQKINDFKSMAGSELSKTDYKVIRQTEQNTLSEDDYNTLKVQRQALRDKCNMLESQVLLAKNYKTIININW